MQSTDYRRRVRKWGLLLMATLSGGTTFVSCDTRLRQDIVDGTKAWIFSLLDPNLFLDALNINVDEDSMP